MSDKPVYLWPILVVVKAFSFIFKTIIMFFHYLLLGTFLSFYFVTGHFFDLIVKFCELWYTFIKLFFTGLFLPFLFISKKSKKNTSKSHAKMSNEEIRKINEKRLSEFKKDEQEFLKARDEFNKNEEKERQKLEKLEQERQKKEEKEKIKQAKIKERKNKKNKKNKKDDSDSYVNEKVKIEQESFSDKLKKAFGDLKNLPAFLSSKIKNRFNNSVFVKDIRNQKTMEREALLIDFDGEDAKKSSKKLTYEYVAKNPEGKVIKSYFEAFSKVEVHSFLLSEGYEVYSIKTNKWIQLMHGSKSVTDVKVKTKDLIFFLTQLSTYIKAGIPLVEALRILSRQFANKSYQKLFKAIIYDLTMGDNFSDAMAKQGNAFPKILINMVKASEMTGELPETLDDMSIYFTEADKTKKQMITAMTYPTIIFVLAILALGFIMIYIVPKFTAIYNNMDNAELPGITVAITNFSNFLQHNWIFLIIGIVVTIILFVYLYKNIKFFRTMTQYILMHIPVVNNIIIYNEVTMFTKTFASLLKHNVFITDTMEILNKITNNEIWKMLILDTITNLAKGEKISTAFHNHWAVPMPAYEMIVTGERTGQLPEMMQKVSDYYQELHKNAVGRIKSFIEPILILFLTGVVGVIVLSIVIPMFGMYDNIS